MSRLEVLALKSKSYKLTTTILLTEYVLDNVITILILNELISSSVQLLKDTLSLFRGAMLENTLDHSTSVGVGAQGVDLPCECADHKLQSPRFDALDALLHHVVPVLIFDALQNVSVQFSDDLLLLFWPDRFESLLNHSTAVHLQCQGQYVSSNLSQHGH